jgi:hypothetical protein
MTRDELIERLRSAQAWIPGKRTCIDFGENGAINLDGVACVVSGEADGQSADTKIRVGWDTWQAIASVQHDPITA